MKTEKAPDQGASPLPTLAQVEVSNRPEPLLTRENLADYLSVSTRTVDRGVRSGHLPFLKLGSGRNAALRFRRSDVDRALEKWGSR